MGFSLTGNDLVSRTIRAAASENGLKIISDILSFDDSSGSGGGGGIGGLLQRAKNLAVNLFSAGKKWLGDNFSFSALWGWAVQKKQQLVNFDWNITDEQLRANGRAKAIAAAGAWGEFFGEAAGTLLAAALGFGVSMIIPVIGGKLLGAQTALKVLEEKGDDIFDAGKDALRQTADAIVDNVASNSFIWARRIIRENAGNGFIPQNLENWGVSGDSFIISEEIDEAVDSIQNDYLRAFVEGFLEQTDEAFIEGGYIAARYLDDEWANRKVLADGVLGGTREASIELDRGRTTGQGSDEQLRVTDLPSNLAIPAITNMIATHRLINNRDIGTFTEPDNGRKILQPYLRTCKIIFRDVEKPPFITETGAAASRHQLTLKALKKDLRWIDFERATRNIRWGAWKIEATLESRVTIVMYAADKEQGKSAIKNIIRDLCEEDYIRVSATEEELDPAITKSPKLVYPEKAIVTIKRESVDGERRDLAGKKYEQQRIEFRLWTEDAPYGTPEYVTNFQVDPAT